MQNTDKDVISRSKNRCLQFAALIVAGLLSACGSDEPYGSCLGPDRNLEAAYSEGARGCGCDSARDTDLCVSDKNGRKVALVCVDDEWTAVEDGPCTPTGP